MVMLNITAANFLLQANVRAGKPEADRGFLGDKKKKKNQMTRNLENKTNQKLLSTSRLVSLSRGTFRVFENGCHIPAKGLFTILPVMVTSACY